MGFVHTCVLPAGNNHSFRNRVKENRFSLFRIFDEIVAKYRL